jgi:hypothetical protein
MNIEDWGCMFIFMIILSFWLSFFSKIDEENDDPNG